MNAALLCDLGGTSIRFCLESASATQLDVTRWLIRNFSGTFPLRDAIAKYAKEKGLSLRGRQLRISVPCDVSGDFMSFDNLARNWSFSLSSLREHFQFCHVHAMNDAVAAFYGMYALMGESVDDFEDPTQNHYAILQEGEPPAAGRFVMIAPGTGLGAVGAHLEEREDRIQGESKYFFSPIPSEFGSTLGWWGEPILSHVARTYKSNHTAHKQIQNLLALNSDHLGPEEQFDRREFLLSGPGLVRIYRCLISLETGRSVNDYKDDVTKPEAIVREALRAFSMDSTNIYVRTLSLFCRALGRATADLGLSFTARGGIFLAGPIVNAITAQGLKNFGFLETLNEGNSAERYPYNVPVYLLTHPYPELVGLNRFEPLTAKPA